MCLACSVPDNKKKTKTHFSATVVIGVIVVVGFELKLHDYRQLLTQSVAG